MSETVFKLIEDRAPEPPQSKNYVLQVRFEPKKITDLRKFCVIKDTTLCEFVRKGARLLRVYYDYAEILLSNADVIIPLLKRIPRRF